MTGIYCTNNIYFYKGWIIEFHWFWGPWPLKKTLEPKAKAGKKFWEIWSEFDKLSADDKKQYLEHPGGCNRF